MNIEKKITEIEKSIEKSKILRFGLVSGDNRYE